MKASGYWTCYAILRRLCFFPGSYLFTVFLDLHQVTELVMHLNFPNYQNWNTSVLGHFFKTSSLNEKYESIRLLNLLCYFSEIVLFPRSYLFTDFWVLHQVAELFMHLNFPNYQNWNLSVLGHFFKISSLNEKHESIRLMNLLCYFSEIVLFPSQLFVHWFLSFASSCWTCYAFEYTKLSKLKLQCFGSFLQNF